MTAWFLVFVVTFSVAGEPLSGILIDNYIDQLTCEGKKYTAKDQVFYPNLICIERPVMRI